MITWEVGGKSQDGGEISLSTSSAPGQDGVIGTGFALLLEATYKPHKSTKYTHKQNNEKKTKIQKRKIN